MLHMLSDFLTGHDELSLRITSSNGQLLFEQLRQPWMTNAVNTATLW